MHWCLEPPNDKNIKLKKMLDLNFQSILVTGGTGSFGKAFIAQTLERFPKVKRMVVFSRDEQKQFEMMHEFPRSQYPALEFMLGDIRDHQRIAEAARDIDILIHSAAMKHVPAAEYNPMECVKTNIIGSQNVIDAALQHNVKIVVALSTDKAAAPVNFYGASKLCLEKLFLHADSHKGSRSTRFSVVRYGNVFGSKGSVVPFFLRKRKEGYLPITHEGMTRFSISMQTGIDLVNFAIAEGWGGEIVLPVAPSYRIMDVAEAIAPSLEKRVEGMRPGEKLHECMFTELDAPFVAKRGGFYIICPTAGCWTRQNYCEKTGAIPIPDGFCYSSDSNTDWLNVSDIRSQIVRDVDPGFQV